MEFSTCRDEIKQYLDAHSISSSEAHWRLFLFDMREHKPAVICLQVHLPSQQPVVFNPGQEGNIQDVLDSHADIDTTLTAWFKANALGDEETCSLLYQNFPSKYVWKRDDHMWSLR